MTQKRLWTKEEDKILVQAIKANPHNKAQVFRTISKKIGRSPKCCSNRWYMQLSNPESKHYVGCMFTMVGIRSRFDNRTINRPDVKIIPVKSNKTIWDKIKKLLRL